MTGARRWLVLGWLVAGQLEQKALAFGALHSDIHPARWQHLCTGAGHPRVQRARRTEGYFQEVGSTSRKMSPDSEGAPH